MKFLFPVVVIISLFSIPRWTMQQSGVTARLRGISAVSTRVAWASGSMSTLLRTTDGGASWHRLSITADELDFRDVDAIDPNTAYVMSVGNGAASRIFKTTDGGATWQLQFKNEDPKAFFDAMAFWDESHGIALGDSIDGQFCILTTNNGQSWQRVSATTLPPALENEGAFAASGSNIALYGKTNAWIATGGAAKSRVLRTHDGGRSWLVTDTPLKAGPSSGIFSIAFRDAKHGIVVGGDYRKESEAIDNAAVTDDGGVTWRLVKGLSGYRSAVAYVPGTRFIVAVGPTGTDYSSDDGESWVRIDGSGFDTLSFAPGLKDKAAIAFAAGALGTLGRLDFAK